MTLNKTDFTGDVLLDGSDGIGDIVVKDGLIQDCRDFSTAVYLSLFGGNKKDNAGRSDETWWGNLVFGTQKDEKIISSFYSVINGYPLTSATLKKAKAAAEYDLKWLIDESIADDVEASIHAASTKKVKLDIQVKKNGKDIFKNAYSFQWQGEN